jgi:uncharacterized protein (DUF697 family)
MARNNASVKEDTMHDIDRTQLESEVDALEADQLEYMDELEALSTAEMESPFDEVEEMDLATELLSISSEEELDQFIGKLLKRAVRGIRKVGSAVGRIAKPLGGILKGVAKKALPFVGGALGSFIPIPGVGTAVGTALGSAVSRALEAELEGMDPEDQEFEMARRFVRLAGTAAKQAAMAQPGVNPQAAVRTAVMTAARQHVPGLQSPVTGHSFGAATARGRSGRWIRRGSKIVLLGV